MYTVCFSHILLWNRSQAYFIIKIIALMEERVRSQRVSDLQLQTYFLNACFKNEMVFNCAECEIYELNV